MKDKIYQLAEVGIFLVIVKQMEKNISYKEFWEKNEDSLTIEDTASALIRIKWKYYNTTT